jgi:DNA-binding beta-propeller fold protein YncE
MKILAGVLLLVIPAPVSAQSGPPFLASWSFPASDIEIASSGNLIAVGSGQGVEFTPDGGVVRTFVAPSPVWGAIDNSLALLPDGTMVISGSPNNNSVYCFVFRPGASVPSWASLADNTRISVQPCEADNTGRILTAGSFHGLSYTVSLWDTTGARVGGFGAEGTSLGYFKGYGDVAVDAAGSILVVDSGNCRVQRFNAGGVVTGSFGSQGDGIGQFLRPWGIAVDDAHGYIYVTDLSLHRIQMFTVTGLPVAKWGSPGSGVGQFYLPYSVAVGLDGRVFVADFGNVRIQSFGYLQASVPVANVTWGKLKTMFADGDDKAKLR